MQIVVRFVGSRQQHQQMTLIVIIQRPLMVNEQQAIVKKATFYMSASLLRALADIVRACYIIVLLQVPPYSSLFSRLL